MKKTASAIWKGDLKKGHGTVSTESGVLSEQAYGFNTRFEGQRGTNPEELIGAAHASCFSMALSNILGEYKLIAESIHTIAEVTLDKTENGFVISAVHLILNAKIPGTDQQTFQEAAQKAKENCPVSKVLNAKISLEITLEN